MRDIDVIAEKLELALPSLVVSPIEVVHPGADPVDLWYCDVPGREGSVQIESATGMCPFLIESTFDDERRHGLDVDEVVATVVALWTAALKRAGP